MTNKSKDWGRFRVIRQLGAGGFGRTLLVEDTNEGDRRVVIKVPHDKKTEAALINELMKASALSASLVGISHPNIVQCLGFAQFEDLYVMILEYVPGPDLRKRIGPMHISRDPQPLEWSVKVFSSVCSGLEVAHKINMLHRDIKPDNILIREPDDVPKLSDFGISKIMQSSSMGSATGMGTFPYMAPEALVGRPCIGSDLWAMCVMLYEMTTGHMPFFHANVYELMKLIEHAQPVAPSGLNPLVDQRLDHLIMKGLEKRVENRFQSARELLQALGATLDEDLAHVRRLFQEGQEDEAERQAMELLSSQRDPRVYMLLGEVYNRRQQFQKAEKIVRQGLGLWPDHPGLHFYLAPALWFQGRQKRQLAIETMERGLALGLAPAQQKQARNLLTSWRAAGRL